MAVTITNNLTNINQADSTTGWSAIGSAGSPNANSDIFQTGSASIGSKLSNAVGGLRYDIGSGRDMTGEHLYVWANTSSALTNFISGSGIRIFLEDTSNNINEYEILDETTYPGGFVRLVLDCDATPTVNGSASITAIQFIAVEFDVTTQIMGNIDTIFVDRIDVQPSSTDYAIRVSGGTSGARGTWSQIASNTTANTDLGIVRRRGGVIIVNGPIQFGDTGTATTYFEDTNSIVVFQNQFVEDGFFALDVVGNSTGTNHFQLGTESGTAPNSIGSGGGTIATAGPTFNLTASDSNVNVCDLLGVVIDGANIITWDTTLNRMVSCTIANSGAITLDNGAEIRDGVITDSTSASGTGAIILANSPTDPEFRDMTLQNCVHAIENEVNGPITWDLRNIKFVNNTADIRFNHSSGLLTVNVLEGGDTPSTSDGGAGGTIDVVNSVSLSVTVVESEDFVTAVVGARVGIHRQSDNSEILNTTTNGSGIASGTHEYSSDVAVFIRVRDEDERYVKIPATITSNGLQQTIGVEDDNRYTPT